jgi:hypothetical protein
MNNMAKIIIIVDIDAVGGRMYFIQYYSTVPVQYSTRSTSESLSIFVFSIPALAGPTNSRRSVTP